MIVRISLRDCAAGILITKPVPDAVYNVELGGEKTITRFARITIFRVYAKEVVHTFFMG